MSLVRAKSNCEPESLTEFIKDIHVLLANPNLDDFLVADHRENINLFLYALKKFLTKFTKRMI